MNVIWYTAASIDGRIANADNSLAFLDSIGDRPHGAEEFTTFLSGIDAILIGATTMRWLIDGGHGWPHDDLPTWLVTHDPTLADQVRPTRAPLHEVSGSLADVLEEMRGSGCRRVWLCGGGSIAGQLARIDRLDEIVVTIAPTIVGDGPSLADVSGLALKRYVPIELADAGGNAIRIHWKRSHAEPGDVS